MTGTDPLAQLRDSLRAILVPYPGRDYAGLVARVPAARYGDTTLAHVAFATEEELLSPDPVAAVHRYDQLEDHLEKYLDRVYPGHQFPDGRMVSLPLYVQLNTINRTSLGLIHAELSPDTGDGPPLRFPYTQPPDRLLSGEPASLAEGVVEVMGNYLSAVDNIIELLRQVGALPAALLASIGLREYANRFYFQLP